MNVLLMFLKSQTTLKPFDIDVDIDFKNGKKLALQVPSIFNNNLFISGQMILLVPKNSNCDNNIQELIKVLDYLHHNQTKVVIDNDKYIINFVWDKQIEFNSLNEMSNSLNTINFQAKITEVK